jgi:hypothetical protein
LAAIKNIPADIADAFNVAQEQRKAATAFEEPFARLEFLEAAKKFSNLEERLRSIEGLSDSDRTQAIYRTQMERAFCLMYTHEIREMDEAVSIYYLLVSADQNDAVCRFRLSQALRRKGEITKARDMMAEAAALLGKDKGERVGRKHWIRGAVHAELSHLLWMLSTTIQVAEERHKVLKDAIATSQLALRIYNDIEGDAVYIIGAINNILYFCWEENNLYGSCALSRAEIEVLLEQARPERVCALLPTHKQDFILDTIERIYLYLDRRGDAAKAASRIIEVVRSKVKRRAGTSRDPDRSLFQKFLSEDELDTYFFAVETVASFATQPPQ